MSPLSCGGWRLLACFLLKLLSHRCTLHTRLLFTHSSTFLRPSRDSASSIQLVVQHADLQDTSAANHVPAAGDAGGGLSQAPGPHLLHLQPRPGHHQHPALALLRQVRDRPPSWPRPHMCTCTISFFGIYIIQNLQQFSKGAPSRPHFLILNVYSRVKSRFKNEHVTICRKQL